MKVDIPIIGTQSQGRSDNGIYFLSDSIKTDTLLLSYNGHEKKIYLYTEEE